MQAFEKRNRFKFHFELNWFQEWGDQKIVQYYWNIVIKPFLKSQIK